MRRITRIAVAPFVLVAVAVYGLALAATGAATFVYMVGWLIVGGVRWVLDD